MPLKIIYNSSSGAIGYHATSQKVVHNRQGSECPDPCEGCVPLSFTSCDRCFDLTFDSIIPANSCYTNTCFDDGDGDIDCGIRRIFISGINNNTFLLEAEQDNPPCGYWVLSEGTVYGHYIQYTQSGVENVVIDRVVVYADLTLCVDGRIRVDNLNAYIGDEEFPQWLQVFNYNPGVGLSDKYLGDLIPNAQATPCEQNDEFGFAFYGGTAVLTPNDRCAGSGEPTVVEATDCATGLSTINVNLSALPSIVDPPYYPKNGGILYRPGDITSDPIDIGTSWVQEDCDPILWPRCSRCDGLAGNVTYDPDTRNPGENIFTVSGVNYYPDGSESNATPSAGVWSVGSCGDLKQAVRCNDANIAGLPLGAQSLVPDTISYDSFLLGGGSAADFSVLLQIVITWQGSDYCVNVPYQCTDDDVDGSEPYQATFVQPYDCSELPFGQNQSGWSCDPNQGPSCSDCCGTSNYPQCCNQGQYRLCTCCLGAPA